jgi:molybdenum cofactor cytidylyltransferase
MTKLRFSDVQKSPAALLSGDRKARLSVPFSAVLLAAGSSSRMLGRFKQLLPLPVPNHAIAPRPGQSNSPTRCPDAMSWQAPQPIGAEEPVVRITARSLLAAQPEEVVVVTGHRGRDVMRVLVDLPVSFAPNPRHEEGQMTSVMAGLAALNASCAAVMICLGDMVLVRPEDYRGLAQLFADLPRDAILIPFHNGQRGNPVTFAASRVPEALSGAINPGCRKLIEDHPQDVVRHEFDHARFTTDMDTPADYEGIRTELANQAGATAQPPDLQPADSHSA